MISVACLVFNLVKRYWFEPHQLPVVETRINEAENENKKKIGLVTSVKGYMVEINNNFISFDTVRKLKIGDVVEYYQVGSNESNTITILSKLEASPGNYGYSTLFEGVIVYIDDYDIIINPGFHKLEIKEVVLAYIPEIGDSVIVQYNENSILLNPESCKVITSTVQKWDCKTGIGFIENEIPFKLDVCENGYTPRLGDQVACSLIPCDKKSNWRCVVLLKWIPKYISKNKIFISKTSFFTITVGEEKIIEMDIKNNSMTQLKIQNIKIISDTDNVRLEGSKKLLLLPGLSVMVKIICTGKEVGLTNVTIEFRFNNSINIRRKINFYTYDSYLEVLSKVKLAFVDHHHGRGGLFSHSQYNLSRYDVPARLLAIYDEWKW